MYDPQFWETRQVCCWSADSRNQEIKKDIFLENLKLHVYLQPNQKGV
jgi:hypothetical protein